MVWEGGGVGGEGCEGMGVLMGGVRGCLGSGR